MSDSLVKKFVFCHLELRRRRFLYISCAENTISPVDFVFSGHEIQKKTPVATIKNKMSLKNQGFVYSGLYIGKSNLAGGKRAGMQNGILYTGALTADC